MKYSHSKNSSFFYKKFHLFNSHLINLKNSNSKLNKKDRDISFDISMTSSYNKFNTLNKTEKSTKDSKFIHNISAPSIYNYKSKHYNMYENNIQKQKKIHNSVINSSKKTKILKIISHIKKRNNNINNAHAFSKKEPAIGIKNNNKNNLKLSSEFHRKNKSKDFIISSAKRERENKSYKKKINIKDIRNLNQYIKDNTSTKKFKDIKGVNINEGYNTTARTKYRYGSISNNIEINKNSKTKRMLEYENIIKLRNKNIGKNFLTKKIKKLKKTVSKENSTKFNSIYLSPNKLNEIYSSKNLFLNQIKYNYNNNSTKNILANSKIKEKKSIKNDNKSVNINYDNYNTKSNKKITVNLNHTNINLKKKQNKLKMSNSIKDNMHTNQYKHSQSQSQIFLSSLSPKLTKTHENSLSILSSKDIFKKNNSRDKKDFEILSYKESRFSIESLNKFRYDKNLQDITHDSKETNELFDLMKNKLENLKKNYSLNLNNEKKIFLNSFPDGPEDFHFRFVELCKQNNSFYRNFYLNTINGDEKDNKNKKTCIKNEDVVNDYQEYFENYGEKVPYI